MENRQRTKLERGLAYLPVTLTLLGILTFSILFFATPHRSISEMENRSLAKLPTYQNSSLLDGLYCDSLNAYFSDHFPLRDTLMGFSFEWKRTRGIRSGEIAIYRNMGLTDTAMVADTILSDTLSDSIGPENQEGDLLGSGLFIYNGMALQLFGGSTGMAKYYASTINKYVAELKGTVTIYNIVFPTPAEFYLPDEYRHMSKPEKPNIDLINASLDPSVKVVDAYSEFKAHQNEYLFYRTDHHATVMGGYYNYVAFCKTAGFTPMDLKTLQRKYKKNYLGSLYSMTHDSRLRDNPDTVFYYIIPGTYKTSIYYEGDQTRPIKSHLLVESSNGYGVFLGGDSPLLKVETGNNNGRRVLVVKNSYGNSFVPFLVPHFEQVYAVDYRSFNLGLLKFIVDNDITDLIFINCSLLANAKWHTQNINRIMYRSNEKVEIESDSTSNELPKDSVIIQKADSVQQK